MSEIPTVTPENLLSALLHQADLPALDDEILAKTLSQAAQIDDPLFEGFELHPQYDDSPKLDETLSTLVLGGTIFREGLTSRIRPTPLLKGKYGKKLYGDFTDGQRTVIDKVAKDLRENQGNN